MAGQGYKLPEKNNEKDESGSGDSDEEETTQVVLVLTKVTRAQDILLPDQERNKEIVVGDKDRRYKKRMKELIHRQAADEINKAVEGKAKS